MHHLDHTRHTRRRLRVTDVRLHRPQPQRPSAGRSWPYVASNACASIGSPSARARAVRLHHVHIGRRQTRRSPAPAGSPAAATDRSARSAHCDAPSWFTAEPRTTASTWWPVRRASDSRSTSSTPDALGPAGAVRRRRERLAPPVRRQTRAAGRTRRTCPAWPSRSRRRPAPATHSPDRSACAARCSATSDDEHAVSTVTAGPSSPNVYDTRPDATLPALPVPQVALDASELVHAGARSRGTSRRRTRRCALPRSGRRVDPGPLERLPRRLQQQPLLRVHRQRLTRRDPEERRRRSRPRRGGSRPRGRSVVPGVSGSGS